MKIYRNDFNTPQMQIEENKKNIELLASIIKKAYRSDVQLLTTDVSIAISDTNADASTIDGWIFDPKGKLFKINGGDGINLLIEFYTSFKGEDGQDGQDGRDGSDDIDDNVIANDKLWSSDKTNSEIGNAKDKGIYYTTTEPTLIDTNIYSLDQMLIGNADFLHIPVKISDLIIYIDANNNPTSIYKVNNIASNILTLSKVGTYAKGKQLYQHNIKLVGNWGVYGDNIECYFNIINDNNQAFTPETLCNYLNNYITSGSSNRIVANGTAYYSQDTSVRKIVLGVYGYATQVFGFRVMDVQSYTPTNKSQGYTSFAVTDTIVAL